LSPDAANARSDLARHLAPLVFPGTREDLLEAAHARPICQWPSTVEGAAGIPDHRDGQYPEVGRSPLFVSYPARPWAGRL